MKVRIFLALMTGSLIAAGSLQALSLETLHSKCTIGRSEKTGGFRLRLQREDCKDDEHCGEFGDSSVTRLTGISMSDLAHEGARQSKCQLSDVQFPGHQALFTTPGQKIILPISAGCIKADPG